MNSTLKIAIVEPSAIIRCGVETVLRQLPGLRTQLTEISTVENLLESLRIHRPELLIINPALLGYSGLQSIKDESTCSEMKCIALLCSVVDPQILRFYDDQIGLYDNMAEIKQKLERLLVDDIPEVSENDEQQTLSSREKEIVICVVKGMTNREIADRLFLSTHTVITHRRNIARKLQIHSASGLTIYAIVNKLVELKDIQ
ncbi:response regulator transcription factor [Parabacteroides bouchesdurhonensis]|uniref:response regulator transcription factor n=1 Tax=Parabacteroides bouchesdurhonensis TaxID=1936995 RepID=UPI000E51CE19|nr:LuxR C-terminal-related transcriptional regulator [Parabacteroides bouchesdurhonensis]RHJ92135.1 DNA-binding response regulator [Bacteroides sp. AM07-16]